MFRLAVGHLATVVAELVGAPTGRGRLSAGDAVHKQLVVERGEPDVTGRRSDVKHVNRRSSGPSLLREGERR